ncbi:MAG: dockerin type I domain-containing protein [Planctomycetes bacterium]|nr:dockerin type I domain-containing protein [Planctomycetota bacterium]
MIDRNGTPNDYTDDFVRYTPAPGAFAPDAFTYTIADVRSGQTDTATVSVTIIPFSGNVPVAVDDSFNYAPETTGVTYDDLNVLQNDQRGPTGTISIPPNGIDSTGTFGSVQLVSVNGQQRVRYNPNGFTGTDQFLYTIVDSNNVTSTATVTIQVAPHTQDDIVKFRVVTTDLNGTPITEIGQGLEFQVRVYVDDVRGEPGRPPLNNPEYPVSSPDQQGVFSAYMDLLYDAGLVAYAGDAKLDFGPEFNQGHFVNSAIPGILDEVGALQGSIQDPLGPGEQLLYAATFTATAQGTVSFRTDPADVLPLHETSVNFPEKAVDYPRIDFGLTTISIVEAPTLVEIQLVATDLNGNPLKNNQISAGSDFLVSAYVQDVRDDIADQFKGVFSAYLDVFYPQTLTRPVASATNPFGFTINFAQPFTEGRKAEFIVNSGIINEVGAFRATAPAQPNVPQAQLLFTTRFTALTPPGGLGSIVFTADPADLLPTNEVSLIRSGTGQVPDPGLSVSPAQIEYINSQVITIVGGAGEAEFTNYSMPTDVNGDGFTSPSDALALINFLNAYGPMDLTYLSAGTGEGEAGDRYFFDTNGDKVISPMDVIGVINYLNMAAHVGGEGESASGEPNVEVAALIVDPASAMQMVAAVDAQATDAAVAENEYAVLAPGAEATVEQPDVFPAPSDDLNHHGFADVDLLLADDLLEDVASAWQGAGESPELLDLLV